MNNTRPRVRTNRVLVRLARSAAYYRCRSEWTCIWQYWLLWTRLQRESRLTPGIF